MLNVGFSEALPPMLRLRKLVPFDSVTSPLAPSVAVQLNVAAMLDVDVKWFVVGDAGDIEKQELFVERPCHLIIAEHLPLEHRRSNAAADGDSNRAVEQVEGRATHDLHLV